MDWSLVSTRFCDQSRPLSKLLFKCEWERKMTSVRESTYVEILKKRLSVHCMDFSVVKLNPFRESFCSRSHRPMTSHTTSLGTWLRNASCTTQHLLSSSLTLIHTNTCKSRRLSIFLWTVNRFSQHCSLVETGMAARSPTIDGIMSKSVSANCALRCGFISQKYTPWQFGAYTNKKSSSLKLLFCSLYCT